MVSFQTQISPKEKSEISYKKRKWEGKGEEDLAKDLKLSKGQTMDRVFDIEYHLERPLPLEWQRCLDIKSGQIHFYNTRTQKKTRMDPRRSPEPLKSGTMSLELELNLPYELLQDHVDNRPVTKPDRCSLLHDTYDSSEKSNRVSSMSRSLSWVNFEADSKEMVAAVCMRCHMLVMLCKSSPECPNCKFMHPPDQNPSCLVKPSFSLLCCKD